MAFIALILYENLATGLELAEKEVQQSPIIESKPSMRSQDLYNLKGKDPHLGRQVSKTIGIWSDTILALPEQIEVGK